MTSPYGPPAAPAAPAALAPAPPGWLVPVKVAVALALVLVGLAAAAVPALIAVVEWTGCFLSCSEPDPVAGALLGGLALLTAATGPVLARLMWRRARTPRAVVLWALPGALLGLVLLSFAGIGL